MAIVHYYFIANSHQMVHQKAYLIKTFIIVFLIFELLILKIIFMIVMRSLIIYQYIGDHPTIRERFFIIILLPYIFF